MQIKQWKFRKGDQIPAWVNGTYMEGMQFGEDVTLVENQKDGGFYVIGGPNQDAVAQELVAEQAA